MTESAVHPPVTVYPVQPAVAADTRITRADYERWGQVVKATGFKIT